METDEILGKALNNKIFPNSFNKFNNTGALTCIEESVFKCLFVLACPYCNSDDHEVCVLPEHGFPRCECHDGYARNKHGKCVACLEGNS